MSAVLPGMHYCRIHQGNHSHYAEHNCAVCAMVATLSVVRTAILTADGPTLGNKILDQVEAALAKAALAKAAL